MKKCLLSIIAIPLLLGCSSSSEITPESSNASSETTSSITTSEETQSSESLTSEDDSSSIEPTSSSESSSKDEPKEIELVTIQEVNEACLALSLPITNPKIKEEINTKFTIQGYVIQNLVSGTTKSGYTPDGKTMLVDHTGWILCSSMSASSTSLYQKVNSYVDKDTTKYEVTGHIANVFGEPELVVESFTWNQNLNIDYEPGLTPSKTYTSLSEYYADTYDEVTYNCKGNGNGDIVALNNLTCIGRADNASTGKYSFIDSENRYLDILYATNTNGFTPGCVYNIVGLQNIYHYNCSFRALRHELISDVTKTSLDTSKAAETTIKDLFNIYSFNDDSYNLVSENYFNAKSKIYKANVYVNHFEKSGKWYVTLSDSDYIPTAENDAYTHYQIPINNNGYWNTTEASFSYSDLYCYENISETVDVYFALYQENHIKVDPIKNKAVWKVYLFEELIPATE